MHAQFSFPTTMRMYILGLVVCLLPLGGCLDEKQPMTQRPPEVSVAKPIIGNVTDYIVFTGTTKAAEEVTLSARVTGKLRSTGYIEGAVVKKGTLLFSIEPEVYEAKVDQARAQMQMQEAALSQAETEYARARKLYQANAGSDTDLVKWREARNSARASVAVAKAELEQASINLGYTKVEAPFDGRVGLWNVDPGNLVGPGSRTTNLGTIIRYDPMYAYFNISERELSRLSSLRQDATALAYRGYPIEMELTKKDGFLYKGVIDYADLGIDPSSGTYLLRAVFKNTGAALLPGMFTRLRLAASQIDKALLVPAVAVGEDQAGKYLLVVGKDNRVARHGVVLGPEQGSNVVISSGITADDHVVVRGLIRARPGRVVTPIQTTIQP